MIEKPQKKALQAISNWWSKGGDPAALDAQLDALAQAKELDEAQRLVLLRAELERQASRRGEAWRTVILAIGVVALVASIAFAGWGARLLPAKQGTPTPSAPTSTPKEPDLQSDLLKYGAALRDLEANYHLLRKDLDDLKSKPETEQGSSGGGGEDIMRLETSIEDLRKEINGLTTQIEALQVTPTGQGLPSSGQSSVQETSAATKITLRVVGIEACGQWTGPTLRAGETSDKLTEQPRSPTNGDFTWEPSGKVFELGLAGLAACGGYVNDPVTEPGWVVKPDKFTGFTSALESKADLPQESLVTLTLKQVPGVPVEAAKGKVDNVTKAAPVRMFPSDSDDTRNTSSQDMGVGTPVDILGQFEDKWRFAQGRFPQDPSRQVWLWAELLNGRPILALDDDAAALPALYLPEDLAINSEPKGWKAGVTDGLWVLSRDITNSDSTELVWSLGLQQGWFAIQVWVPKGSAADANYKILVKVSDDDWPELPPLKGASSVTINQSTDSSSFADLGTYYLQNEHHVRVSLKTDGDVKTGWVRVIKIH
ncbi:MAG: hypothetical protein GXY76_22705 [Chloroflexi bacterium]|nr:hypothetical protein [Chloroflexota bacterium]